jgi:hypothetical protein
MTVSIRTTINGTRTGMLLVAIAFVLAMAVPVFAQEMKVPETAKDHHEMADHYRKVAAPLAKTLKCTRRC